MKQLMLLAVAVLALGSCQTKREVAVPANPDGNGIHRPRPEIVEKTVAAVPRATVYRTTGNYNDHVFITTDASGNIISYPAPSDVTKASAPLQLRDGWLLDRRGITPGAVFLTWTYAQYHALDTTPSLADLKAHIIEGAKVADIMKLPITTAEAEADTTTVNTWIAANNPTATFKP